MKRYVAHRRRGPVMMVFKGAVWLALGALMVGVVMALWNWLMPSLFTGARTIDYWQALALIVLSRLLFGRGGRWRGRRHRHAMSADERERFSRRFHRGCHNAGTEGTAGNDGQAAGAPQ